MISGISKFISAAALTLMVFTGAQAKPSVSEQNIKTKAKEDTVMTMSRATLLVPRPALEPVKSIDPQKIIETVHIVHKRANGVRGFISKS